MASTDKALGRLSAWSTVALLMGFLALPFQPGRVSEPAKPPARATSKPVAAASKGASRIPAAQPQSKQAGDGEGGAALEPPEDVWTEAELADGLRACLRLLAPVVADVTLEEPVKKGPCGTPAPLTVHSIGAANKVVFDPPPHMNCRLTAGLARWVDTVLQPAAREVLGSRITRIVGASSYACRNMYGQPDLPLSEHATGNAVDIAGFVTADGRTLRVSKGWGPTERDIAEAAEAKAKKAQAGSAGAGNKDAGSADAKSGAKKVHLHKAGYKSEKEAHAPVVVATAGLTAAKTTEAAFLRRLHHGACSVFGTVLGPEANEAHRDHFHFDMKERKGHGVCH